VRAAVRFLVRIPVPLGHHQSALAIALVAKHHKGSLQSHGKLLGTFLLLRFNAAPDGLGILHNASLSLFGPQSANRLTRDIEEWAAGRLGDHGQLVFVTV
jgi:hypothetical protein